MAAKAEEPLPLATPPSPRNPVRDPAEQRTAADYFDVKAKDGEEKGTGFREAKRRKTCQLAIEKLSSAKDERGEGGDHGFSFAFAVDARVSSPIETTPKFGSFNSAADLGSAEGGKEGGEEAAKSGTEGGKGGIVEGKIGI